MRWILRGLLALVAMLALVACALQVALGGDEGVPPRSEGALRVATLNVHYIRLRADEGPWSVGDWEVRRGPLDLAFKALDADLVAFQEMESFGGGEGTDVNLALDWLLERNPGYAAAAVGDPREFPSTQPILYRRDALEVEAQGWFFFSDTPDVIYSRTFDGSWPAFASWARFTPEDGAAFTVMNVHFEYRSGSNRMLSAALVAERIAPMQAEGPVILLGDLNALHGSRTMAVLEGAGLTFADVSGATYHFDRGINLFGAIDHVGVSDGVEVVGEPVVVRRRFDGEWPTDHYPVVADLRLPLPGG